MKLTSNGSKAELKLSTVAGAYWNEEAAANQEDYDRLYSELVPDEGEADTVHGMILRAAMRIYYDMYNNGGWNMVDNIHDDRLEEGDEDYEEPEFELSDLYSKFFTNLETWMPEEHQEAVKKVKDIVLVGEINFDIAFDLLIDRVVHVAMTTNNIGELAS